MSRGTRQRTEEYVRDTRDWLELQTVAWNPLFHQIDWHARTTFENVRDGLVPGALAATALLEQINNHLFTYLPQIAQNTRDINVSIVQSISGWCRKRLTNMKTQSNQEAYRRASRPRCVTTRAGSGARSRR